MYPKTPSIRFQDPLATFLGSSEDLFIYTFADAVKLAGHACPTVAGAFLLVIRAMEHLYPDEIPQRGDIGITVSGRVEEGVNGPMTQVMTLMTGAAMSNGFRGLGGQYGRKDLLRFQDGVSASGLFTFERMSNRSRVSLYYSPEAFPPHPRISQLLPQLLSGQAVEAEREEFRSLWQARVVQILEDGGRSTLFSPSVSQP